MDNTVICQGCRVALTSENTTDGSVKVNLCKKCQKDIELLDDIFKSSDLALGKASRTLIDAWDSLNELCEAYEAYIAFLHSYTKNIEMFAYVHGNTISAKDLEKATKLREAITEIKGRVFV